MGKFSRDKGKRGDLDVVNKLGGSARRVGRSYVPSQADVETDFAVYQVKNKTIGGSAIAGELHRLALALPEKNTYVVFKVKGKWYVAEAMGQHVGDYGDVSVEDNPGSVVTSGSGRLDMQKSINSDQIKAIIASYWRYIRQCPVIALEVNSNLSSYSGEETADVLAVDKLRYLIETEVKVSLADLRRDIEKEKQRDFSEG
jgi:hypothetical protein